MSFLENPHVINQIAQLREIAEKAKSMDLDLKYVNLVLEEVDSEEPDLNRLLDLIKMATVECQTFVANLTKPRQAFSN